MENTEYIKKRLSEEFLYTKFAAFYTILENMPDELHELVSYFKDTEIYYPVMVDAKDACVDGKWSSLINYVHNTEGYDVIKGDDPLCEMCVYLSAKAGKTLMNSMVFIIYNVHHVDEAFIEKMEKIRNMLYMQFRIRTKIALIGTKKQYSRMLSKVPKEIIKTKFHVARKIPEGESDE